MSIDSATANIFNFRVLRVHIDNINNHVSDVDIAYHYSNNLRMIPTYYARLQHTTLLAMEQLDLFFRNVVGVNRQVRTGVTGSINVGIIYLIATCSNINRHMFDILSSQSITASSFDDIIRCLNIILHIVEYPYEEDGPTAYFPPVDTYHQPQTPPTPPPAYALATPYAHRNKRKSKALPKAEVDKEMADPCSICFEPYTRADSVSTCCNHQFCKTCYGLHEKSVPRGKLVSCPMCRKMNPVVTEYRARKTRTVNPKNVTTIGTIPERGTNVGIGLLSGETP
jgi:hypothetical protein